ncbi:MAG: phosphotransferase [Protaetiibacter sp.]
MRSLAGRPVGRVDVPDAVRARIRTPEPIWRNEEGGVTFRDLHRGVFAKWNPVGTAISLAAERDRLLWAAPHHPVPEVLEYAVDEAGELVVTRALPGDSAVAERWLTEPRTAVRAIGEGLRALHEHLPREECAFSWQAHERLTRRTAEARAELGDPPRRSSSSWCVTATHAPRTRCSAQTDAGSRTSISEPSASPTAGPISRSRA